MALASILDHRAAIDQSPAKPEPSRLSETLKMVFVRTLFLKDTRMVYLEDCTSLEECRSALTSTSGVPGDHLVFYNNGRRMVSDESPVDALGTIDACLGLPGGKGGFGSMLRALGAQIEKTTNK